MLIENLRKIRIYFRKWDSYWKLTDSDDKLVIDPGKPGRYPLDFKPRVLEGHYPHFDKNGVPMWPKTGGTGHFYHYTTMFSYALGQSDFYLLTGKKEHLNKIIAVADYILLSVVEEDGVLLLKEVDDMDKHTGNVSAMTQGEAMSVLCRASQYSGNEKYIKAAELLISVFNKDVDNNGVVGAITKLNSPWYEEYVDKPLRHVLNGMVYSIWGLNDVYIMTGNKIAKRLYNGGIEYIKAALPYFDTGYWTYYWIPEDGKNYVASMMYHNLHICMMQALYRQTNDDIFLEYADKFIKYAKNPLCRIKAAKAITFAKIRR